MENGPVEFKLIALVSHRFVDTHTSLIKTDKTNAFLAGIYTSALTLNVIYTQVITKTF